MSDLRVYLADDHAIVREGLKVLINAQSGMVVIGEAADGLLACEQNPKLRPDIVVMDVSMPGFTGSQASARLRPECPTVKVVALTVHNCKCYQFTVGQMSRHLIRRTANSRWSD